MEESKVITMTFNNIRLILLHDSELTGWIDVTEETALLGFFSYAEEHPYLSADEAFTYCDKMCVPFGIIKQSSTSCYN